jgi:hypothetical protein
MCPICLSAVTLIAGGSASAVIASLIVWHPARGSRSKEEDHDRSSDRKP